MSRFPTASRLLRELRSRIGIKGKKEKQAAAFPELQAEFESKRKELYKPYRWPDVASRKRPDFIEELRKLSEGRIGGTPEEQNIFFESVIAKYPQCFWTGRLCPSGSSGSIDQVSFETGSEACCQSTDPSVPIR